MKRLVSLILVFLFVTSLPLGGFASETDGTQPSAETLREVLRFDFENGSVGTGTKKATQVYENRTEGGNGFLVYGLTESYSGGAYYQLHAKDHSSDYLIDSTATQYKQYYNSSKFVLSLSIGGSTKMPENSYIECKSSNRNKTLQLLYFKGGEVRTKNGTTLGVLTPGAWLNVTLSFDVTSGEISYFKDGRLMAEENLGDTAQNVSYFNLYIADKAGNALCEWFVDNLSLSFGEVSEADTEYFASAFSTPAPDPAPTPEDGTVREIFVRDFEDNIAGSAYRPQLCTVIEDPADARNSCLQIRSDGAYDLYYHIDAKETSSYQIDPEADAKSNYYFDSSRIVISAGYSRTEGTIYPVTAQIKSTTVGGAQPNKTLYTVDGSGNIKSAGGAILASLTVGKWTAIDIGIDLDAGTITYYVDRKFASTESFSFPYKVSYFNISGRVRDEGDVLLVDGLYVGYGSLSDAFYEIPVEFVTSQGKETVRYKDPTFTLPDTAAFWYGRVDGEKVLLAAGSEVALERGLSFTACEGAPELLDGASIRADYHTGLRFGAAFDKAWYDTLSAFFGSGSLQVGVLIVPTDFLADGTEFTHAALSEKHAVLADIRNSRWYSSDAENYYCYGTLTELKAENYARSFSARAYVEITDGSGAVTVLYSEYRAQDHARSAYEVASRAFADTEAAYTEAQRSAIKAYLDGVLPLTLSDGVCTVAQGPVGYTSPYTVTGGDATSVTVSLAGGTVLKSVTLNGSPIYSFTESDGTVTVTLSDMEE